MNDTVSTPPRPLRIIYVEDNPLIVFHVEQMIEDLGHVFVASFDSFVSLRTDWVDLSVDGALVDIDLTDGRTGPQAAEWLNKHGIPSFFLTGQAEVAARYRHVSLGTLTKPIEMEKLAEALEMFRFCPIT